MIVLDLADLGPAAVAAAVAAHTRGRRDNRERMHALHNITGAWSELCAYAVRTNPDDYAAYRWVQSQDGRQRFAFKRDADYRPPPPNDDPWRCY